MQLGVKIIREGAVVPHYKHRWDAGMDLSCVLDEDVILAPNQIQIFNTGLFFDIPRGYEVQIRPRSGLACKFGVTVVNAPGTIDSGYTGEVMVGLVNVSEQHYKVQSGDRIAQAVFSPVEHAFVELVSEVGRSERGDGGFGSTGV
jgi:dUTP pyrophosphatase